MFPIHTPEIVHAEQAHRLEGFRRWSRRRGQGTEILGVDYTPPKEQGHHVTFRPVFGR